MSIPIQKTVSSQINTQINLLQNNKNPLSKNTKKEKIKKISDSEIEKNNKIIFERKFSITQLSHHKMYFIRNFIDNEEKIEDEHLTEEYFNSIFIDEMISTIFVGLSIGSGIIYYEIRICDPKKCFDNYNEIINISLISVSAAVIGFIFCMIPRYIHYFYLYRAAKYISSIDNFFQSGLFSNFIFDLIFSLIHPNLLFKNKYFTTSKKWNLLEVKYNINDFLLVIMLCRSYYFMKFIILYSNYYGARADRICKMMGKQSGYIFSFKCLLISKTLQTLIFITIFTCVIFAYILKIIEGPVYLLSNKNDNENNHMKYMNCFWTVLVTMTTVGYGDYFPKSVLGRFIMLNVIILGTFIMALNINNFQSKTELNEQDRNSLNLILRLEEKDEIKNLAVSYFKNNYMYVITKRKYFRGEISNDNENKKIMINRARDKFFYRKKYKNVVHRFQIKYKMATDVDQVKKKIRKLDDTVIDLDNKLKNFYQRYSDYYYSKYQNKNNKNNTNFISNQENIKKIEFNNLEDKKKDNENIINNNDKISNEKDE